MNLQVVEATQGAIQLHIPLSGRTPPETWDLRCEIREKVIGWPQREYPDALPRLRAELKEPDAARHDARASEASLAATYPAS